MKRDLPPVVRIIEPPTLWLRLRRRVGVVLCWFGIHLARVQHEADEGHLGAPPRRVAVLKCWRCGRPQ